MPVNRRSFLLVRLLPVFVSFFLLNSLQGQVCSNWQYGKSYNGMGSGNMHFIFPLTDGNFLMGGPVNGKIMLIKINADGDTLWNKRYDCDGINMSGIRMQALQGKDGNIYCMNVNQYLLKLDLDGNLLDAHKLVSPMGGTFTYMDFDVLDNGDLVFLIDRSPGYMLMRTKPDGSAIIWSTFFSGNYTNFREILVDGNRIIAIGQVNSSSKILGFDAISGALTIERGFTINNINVTVKNIYGYAGGYIIHGNYTPSRADNHIVIRFDKSLNITKAYTFTNISQSSLLSFAVEPDGSYYLAHGISRPMLLHVNKNDALVWSKMNSSIIFANSYLLMRTNQGLMATSGGNYTAVPTGINYWYFCVSKSDLNGEVGNCSSTNHPVTLVANAASQNSGLPVSSSPRNEFQFQPATATIIPEKPGLSTNCLTLKTCSDVTITGSSNICGNTATTFQAVRNAGCSLPVQWKIEGAATDNQLLNDYTLSVNFLQNGNYRLIASLTGACMPIADTFDVQVTVIAPASINLGPDTPICINNTIKLNAGNGFATYKWQDNSTNSFYDVTQPGKYFVEATDACSHVYHDTVLVNAASVLPFELGADLSKCNDDTIRVPAPAGLMNYLWLPNINIVNTQAPTAVVYPANTTKYIVSAQRWPGCIVKDSLWVTVNRSATIHIGNDTIICMGDSLQLAAASGFMQYNWNTGSAASFVTVKQAGNYYVTATDINNCTSRDTMRLTISVPAVHLVNNPALCEGSNRWLDAGSGYQSYLWNTGSTEQRINVSAIGTWYVTVVDQLGCKASDTTAISLLLPAPESFLPADTSLCGYARMDLKPLKTYASYQWSTGDRNNKITVSKSGLYALTVTDAAGCEGKDEIRITPKDCLEGFFIPNAFSPNGDGRNDVYKPTLLGNLVSYRFTIYNRWGQRVFETVDAQKGWDGLLAGKPQFNNEFIWVCAFQFEGQQARTEKGSVIPVR